MARFISLFLFVCVTSLFSATAPDTTWTSGTSYTDVTKTTAVDGSNNIYSAWASTTTIQVRKITSAKALGWTGSVDLGTGRTVTVRRAVVNGTTLTVVGKYTNTKDTLFLQKFNLSDGSSAGSFITVDAGSYTTSDAWDACISGSDIYILGLARRITGETTKHYELWKTSGSTLKDLAGSTVGSSLSGDTTINPVALVKTTSGYGVLGQSASGRVSFFGYNSSGTKLWGDTVYTGTTTGAGVTLKGDTAFVYYGTNASPYDLYRGKYNNVVTSASKPARTNTKLFSNNTTVMSLKSVTYNSTGDFISISDSASPGRIRILRTVWADTIYTKILSGIQPVTAQFNISIESDGKVILGANQKYVEIASDCPMASVTTPGTLTINSPTTLTWTESGKVSSRTVEYNNGGGWTSISGPSAGSVSWTPTTAGTYQFRVTLTNAVSSTATSGSFSVNKINQTISFGALSAKTYGDAPFNLAATSSSGLTVSYSSSNTSVATISGTQVTIIGAGSTNITASQAGNATYNSASDVVQSLTVNKANQTISFSAPSAKTYGDANFGLSATASSGLSVSYSSSNTSVAIVSGSTVTIIGAGSTTITASQAGNTNYNGASDVLQTLTVNKASQSISFNALSTKTYGDVNFNLSATASSGLSVSFASSNTAVASISGSTVTINGAGSTTITASQAGNSNYNTASDVQQTLTVNKATATVTLSGLAQTYDGSAKSVTATTNPSGKTVGITYDGSISTPSAVGSYAIVATINDDNYQGNASGTLVISKASQTITFNSLSAKTVGDAPFALTATSSSGLSVSYTSSNTSVATVSGSTITIVGAGSSIITASQSGNGNYNPASDAQQTLTVNTAPKLDQTITFNPLSSKTYGDAQFNLTATASSGLSVSYSSSNTSVATVSGSTVTIVGSGSTTITASQGGNSNYNSATDVAQNLTVNKATATVSLSNLSYTYDGSAKVATASTNPSGLNVGITYDGSSVAPSAVGSYAVVATVNDVNYQGSASNTLIINAVVKIDQTITFTSLSDRVYGSGNFSLSASASSGLPVSFSSSNTAVATISGSTVTIVGAGITIITASQAGNGTYNVAPSIDQTLTITKATQTITFNALSSKTFGDENFALTATASSGFAVNYTSSNTSVATVSGTTVTIIGAGTTAITSSQSGNENYSAASDVTQSLTVNKASATVVISGLTSTYDGSAKSATVSTTPLGLTNTVTYDGSATAPVNSGSYAVVATISETNYQGSASGTLVIGKASQTITFNTLSAKTVGEVSYNLSATASSGLAVTFTSSNTAVATVSGSTVTIVGAGITTITASQGGNSNYSVATDVQQTLTVNSASKLDQTITFNALTGKIFGDSPFGLVATASSGLNVTFSSSNTSVATVAGSTITIVGAGSTIITASQAGNDTYNSTSTQQTFSVSKAVATISLSNLTPTYDGSAKSATVTSTPTGLTIGVTYDGSSTAPVQAGSYAVVATVNSANYTGNATGALVIGKASQSITFSTLANKTTGDAPFALSASASSGLPVSFSSSNTSVATISGSTVTVVGAGNTVITASQAGNSNYNSALDVVQNFTVVSQNQSITFNALSNKVYGDGSFTLHATAVSGLPVTYASSDTNVAKISDSTVTVMGAGTTTITATQAGNGVYSATSATQPLTVDKATQTVSFEPLSVKSIGDPEFNLGATSSAGLPVAYTSSNPSVATVTGATVSIKSIGTVTITATQAGNVNYNAISVQQVLTIRDNTVPTVTLLSPNGCEVWTASSVRNITWTANDNVGIASRVISYSTDEGQSWTVIDSSTGNTGTLNWALPTTATDKAMFRIRVYDAQGNSAMDVSDAKLFVIGTPLFTSSDSVAITGGTNFSYKVQYQFPGNPPAYKDTILSKPAWIQVQGDSIWGTVPNETRNDTVKVMIGAGEVSDTLVLVIHIKAQPMTGTIAKTVIRDCFGLNITNRMVRFGVNAGNYQIAIYNMAGQVVFNRKTTTGSGLVEMVPLSSSTAYVVRLTQGNRSLTRKFQVVR